MTTESKALLASALEIETAEIPDNASLDSFEPWDSLGHMKLMMALESRMGCPLEVEEILAITDLKSLDELLRANKSRISS